MRAVLLCLLVAAVAAADADPVPAQAHQAFAARHALEARHTSGLTAEEEAPQREGLQTAALLAQFDCLNTWFSDPAHLPTVDAKDEAHHQLSVLCGQVRTALTQKTWPIWKPKGPDDFARCQPLIDLGREVGKLSGPDWLDDLCNGAHKGTHRDN